jgi:hypothetical protein
MKRYGPHVAARKTHQRLQRFSFVTPKRLLQQYRHQADCDLFDPGQSARLDNIPRPLVMARGLDTPMLIILIGVLGGTVSYGITGLFLGPIILAVIWELLVAWTRERESA